MRATLATALYRLPALHLEWDLADPGRWKGNQSLMGYEPKVLAFAVDGIARAPDAQRAVSKQNTTMHTRRRAANGSLGALSLVAAALCLVHANTSSFQALAGEKAAVEEKSGAAEKVVPEERAFHGALPPNVADMREQILAAVHAGDVAELKGAIEWNEIKPDFGEDANKDPIAYWKKISADGEGREVLAAIANLLALPPARLAIGKDPENTMVYVWPYLAELPLDSLKPQEEVDLYRLVPPAAAKSMRDAKKWAWWRIAIGADGTWHTFRKYQ